MPWHLEAIAVQDADGRRLVPERGGGVVVAIVDTGVCTGSGEIAPTMVQSVHVYAPNGQVEPLENVPSEGRYNPDLDHGTAVASFVNGRTNGVARDARLMSVVLPVDGSPPHKVLKTRRRVILAALEYLRDNPGFDALNLSIGDPLAPHDLVTRQQYSDLLDQITVQGAVVVGAIGNLAPHHGATAPLAPVCLPEAVSVGASDRIGLPCGFSLQGPCQVTGRDLPDTYAPGEDMLLHRWWGPERGDGTSFSSPIVAAVAALFLQRRRGATPEQCRDALFTAGANGQIIATLLP